MNPISKYAHLVRFSHTIFAMPFALTSFVYALRDIGFGAENSAPVWWLSLLVKVVLCMVFARNVAMGFNRWADRRIDAENPRTADREIPAGRISARAALWFVIINAALFIAAAASINSLTAALSPVALIVIMSYSYCKRFTSLSHLVLGLSLAIAPVGAYIAVTGRFALAPCVLALLVLTWCGGFDIIYALQDRDFDRAHGLHSIPARFSVSTALNPRVVRGDAARERLDVGRHGHIHRPARCRAHTRNTRTPEEHRHSLRYAQRSGQHAARRMPHRRHAHRIAPT